MAYSSKRFKDSWRYGGEIEVSFGEILKKFDPNSRPATKSEQYSHIDFVSEKLGTYDVKAKKRINRGDNSTQNELIWIEFKNVRGDVGWLYGNADYIAFEQEKEFLVVNRLQLVGLAESKCKVKDRVNFAKDALYKGYSRKDRQDLISIIKISDIKDHLEYELWQKK